MVTTFFVWGFFGGFGFFFVNLLALLAGDIHEECMSASTPEQLCVPVSRAAGRCGQALPIPPPWSGSCMTPPTAMAFSVTGRQFKRTQSPVCWWALKSS